MLPSVMRWNKQDNAERQALVSEAMGTLARDAATCLDGLHPAASDCRAACRMCGRSGAFPRLDCAEQA
jgi:hypothetical protein